MPWTSSKAKDVLAANRPSPDVEPLTLETIVPFGTGPAEAGVDEDAPRELVFHCAVLNSQLVTPCQLSSCVMHSPNHETWLNCAGHYAAGQATQAAERLSLLPISGRSGHKLLQASAEGKLSITDLAVVFDVSRRKVQQNIADSAPMLASLREDVVTKTSLMSELGDVDSHFTHVHLSTRLCVACEQSVEVEADEESEITFAIVEGQRVAWCSPECLHDFPEAAVMLSLKFKQHWLTVYRSLKAKDQLKMHVPDIEARKALRALAGSELYTQAEHTHV